MKHTVISSELGDITLWPTNNTHVYLEVPKLTIRGVKYYFSMHVYRHSNGEWEVGQEETEPRCYRESHGSYMSRLDYAGEPSRAARDKAIRILLPLVREWIKNHPVEMRQAQREDLVQHREKTEWEIRELEEKLATLKSTHAKLQQELINLS